MELNSTPVRLRNRRTYTKAAGARLDAAFSGVDATETISWAVDTFGPRLVLTSSFADTLLIDLALSVNPDIEIAFLDTGFHFAETLDTVRKAMDSYSLNLTVLRPTAQAADVWANGSDTCCEQRKSAVLQEYLLGHADAWMTGLRRADSTNRGQTPIVSLDRRGLLKINPLAEWSDEQVNNYMAQHNVIVNPLVAQGYSSIGCWPCTVPSADGRNGRWADQEKTECGIHQ